MFCSGVTVDLQLKMQTLAAQVVLDSAYLHRQPYQTQGYDYWEAIHCVSEPSPQLLHPQQKILDC